ncbi:transposase, partial [Vibrio sp. 10N.261.49.A5]
LLTLVESELQLIPPSWRTLATWKKSYFEAGKDPCALIPKHTFKGNRQKEFDSQSLVDEAINSVYLTRERLSAAEAYRYYKSRVIQLNRGIVEGKIKPIAERSFYNRI